MHDRVFLRSLYFFDPDGILLEFAAWTRGFTEDDVDTERLDSNASRSAV